ncbi:MAG: dihydropteroate synthase [Acidobacteria bacterium]|nr:MAG: dihydropteroate synthase [Acidobacteriota bacterium]
MPHPSPPHPPGGAASRRWRLALPRGRRLELAVDGRPKVMGVVNVTPDSFSDGGRFLDPRRAVEHALELIEEGADLVDLGAESTRPGGGVYGGGAAEVPAALELERLMPVLEALRRHTDAPISVDTRKGEVAAAALAAGADLINDVGGLRDGGLVAAVARHRCPVVVMHSRGDLATMQRHIRFRDVAGEVAEELAAAARRARDGGIDEERLIFDPGIGFGKTPRQNLLLLCRLAPLHALGRPLLIGASRKSFIAHYSPSPPDRRLGGSLAAAAWAARRGAAIVRVHDVAETVQFFRLSQAIAEQDSAIHYTAPARRSRPADSAPPTGRR